MKYFLARKQFLIKKKKKAKQFLSYQSSKAPLGFMSLTLNLIPNSCTNKIV